MEGLVSAAQKYSPKEGVNFQQYAQLRIRGSIIDFLRKTLLVSTLHIIDIKSAPLKPTDDT